MEVSPGDEATQVRDLDNDTTAVDQHHLAFNSRILGLQFDEVVPGLLQLR